MRKTPKCITKELLRHVEYLKLLKLSILMEFNFDQTLSRDVNGCLYYEDNEQEVLLHSP